MNNRIKEVRKDKKLTQDAFAADLNLSKNYVWMIEKGEREPGDRTIKDICRIYGINEDWLRFGQGEMYAPKTRAEEVAELAKDFLKNESELRYQLVQLVAQMPDDMLEYFENWLVSYVESKNKNSNLPSYDSAKEQ